MSSVEQTFQQLRLEIPVRVRREGIPGATVVILGHEGIAWSEAFGDADTATKSPVCVDTLFGLQSCSKTFTATAVLLAVQDGILDLDRPIFEYVPDVHLQSRYECRPEQRITLRHLLAHKAGLTHEAPLGNNYSSVTEQVDFDAHVRSIRRTWLRFPVGQRYAYSNLGIDLAGYILQQTAGVPFAEYLQRRLFDPLGLARSTFDSDVLAAFADCARGYDPFVEAAGVPLLQHVPMMPSGGMYASAGDVARYLLFQLNRGRVDGRCVLEEQLLGEMLTVPYPVEGQFEGYGLGVAINRFRETNLYHHSGGGFGFLSDMLWCPDLGWGVVFLTNSSHHSLQGSLPHSILERLAGPVPERRKAALPEPDPSASDTAAQTTLVGQYAGRLPDGWEVRREGDHLLMRRLTGKDIRRLQFYLPNQAYTQTPARDSHWRFARDGRGRPLFLEHIDSGARYDYNGGPADARGEDRTEWHAYTGTYLARLLGAVPWLMRIRRKKGHLCLQVGPPTRGIALRLNSFQPGLFFTSTGEAVDFTGDETLFFGVPVRRIGRREELRQWLLLIRGLVNAWRSKRRRRSMRLGEERSA